jgi:hypothetical protein
MMDMACTQFIMLLVPTIDVQKNELVPNAFAWPSPSGQYTAHDTYHMMCHGYIRSEPLWRSKASLKRKIFCWLDSNYSLRPILLFANMDISSSKICLDTSILVKSNMGRREYKI